MDAGAAVAGAGLVVGGIVWLVRLEGRINMGESKVSDLQADIHEIKEDVKSLLRRQYDRRSSDV
jgi:outer membrane murein-binding lipoprotein Lpp